MLHSRNWNSPVSRSHLELVQRTSLIQEELHGMLPIQVSRMPMPPAPRNKGVDGACGPSPAGQESTVFRGAVVEFAV